MSDLRGLLGLALLLLLAFAVSEARGRINWRTVAVGLALQVGLAVLVLRFGPGKDATEFVAGQSPRWWSTPTRAPTSSSAGS